MKKSQHMKRWLTGLAVFTLGAGLLALVLLSREGEQTPSESGEVTAGEVDTRKGFAEADTWSAERLYKEDELTYTLVDNGIVKVNETLNDWVEESVSERGVYTLDDEEFTYVMITTGENDEALAIQLYDVRQDRQRVYVGFDLVETDIEDMPSVSFMLIRFEQTDKLVRDIVILP